MYLGMRYRLARCYAVVLENIEARRIERAG